MASSELIRVPSVWAVKLAYAQPVVDMPAPEDDFEEAAQRSRRGIPAPEDCACEICRHHRRIYDLIVRNELRQAGKEETLMEKRYYRISARDHREGARPVQVRRPSGLVELATKQLLNSGYETVTVRKTNPPPGPVQR